MTGDNAMDEALKTANDVIASAGGSMHPSRVVEMARALLSLYQTHEELKARVAALEGNQRTPGTCEKCDKCDRAVGLVPDGCDLVFVHGSCPIRSALKRPTEG